MIDEEARLATVEAEEIVRLSKASSPEAIERIAHTVIRSIDAYHGGPRLAALVARRLRDLAGERRKAASVSTTQLTAPDRERPLEITAKA